MAQKNGIGLMIGGSATEKTLPSLSVALGKVLASNAGDDVKKAAIAALISAFNVTNVTVSNSVFHA